MLEDPTPAFRTFGRAACFTEELPDRGFVLTETFSDRLDFFNFGLDSERLVLRERGVSDLVLNPKPLDFDRLLRLLRSLATLLPRLNLEDLLFLLAELRMVPRDELDNLDPIVRTVVSAPSLLSSPLKRSLKVATARLLSRRHFASMA
mmetsp:Transcript_13884/g.24830  ORF Transcript_13884/g.24830 Transcript_13884/m.24830 type:complete len:148 (-) Transcript_13884:336-779(-)